MKYSPNREPRRSEVVDILVLHYTGMPTAQGALSRLMNPDAKVSAHYLIDEQGVVTQIVPESDRAWHAGVAFWKGETDINSRSVGIELANPGDYRSFTTPQMESLLVLAQGILKRHPISPSNVIGHSDVAVGRKIDPGPLFPWRWLAERGIGVWPFDGTEQADMTMDEATQFLSAYGYDVSRPEVALTAFQLHFRPELADGVLDHQTAGRLQKLAGISRPLGLE